MARGPHGEWRPDDPIAAAVHTMKIATGEIEEEDQWVANPYAPWPFPKKLEAIRKAAVERWGSNPISQHDIVLWIYEGCPDASGVCITLETRQPSISPEKYLTTLFKRGVFIPAE